MTIRRRYEIAQDSLQIREDVLRAMGEKILIQLDIHLADIYEDGPEIPQDIEYRNIAVDVVGVSKLRGDRLRAVGFTEPERQAVSLVIPSVDNPNERSRLSLLDK